MLSESERRALDEIELTLASNDPSFAQMLGDPATSRASRRARLVYDAVAVFSMLLGVGCVALGQIGAGLVAMIFAAVVVMARRARFPLLAEQPPLARPVL